VVRSVLTHAVARLVHVSSLAVLHLAASADGQIIDEAWPSEPAAASRGDYTRTKLAAEQIVTESVKSHGLPAIVLRPGEIIGPDDPRLSSGIALRLGRTLVALGGGGSRVPVIDVDDVVEALVLAADRGPFDGTVLHLVDPQVVTRERLLRRYVASLSGHWRVVHVPRPLVIAVAGLVELAANAVGLRPPISRYRVASALSPGTFSSHRATEVLGWSPRTGVARNFGVGTGDAESEIAVAEHL
jgi:nucleoside-diphosphate-sugar epimerase